MNDCKCKNILNLQPKCEPVLDLNPNCPVTLNVASVSRGPKGNDATINGYNAINIDTAGGLIGTMDDQTQTYTIDGSAKQDVIDDLETIRSGATLGATAVQSVTEGTENGTISVDGTDVAVHGLGSAAYTASTAYDVAGSASTAETNAKNYADGLASNYATAAQGQLADTALQPNDNISELVNDAGYITSAAIPTNYVTTNTTQTITGEKVFSGILNIPAGKTYIIAGNGGAKLGYFTYDIDGFSNITLQTMTASTRDINFKTNNSGKVKYNGKEVAIKTDIPTAVSQLTNDSDYQTGTEVSNSIATETTNRENADINLQNQIDAITASSDVTDIVGTYAELQAYDTTTLPPNSIIKVLQDESRSDETTYYRWVITGGVGAWVLIGEEGPYYTKGEADAQFVPQTRTVNNKALSSNITLTASDVGALPDSTVIPTVNDATLTIQENGTSVGTFTANASSNVTANITVPTDTSDLTNGAGFITGITSGDVTTALGYTPYDSTNPSGYITVTALNGYATQTWVGQQGYLTSISSGDITSALGYTPANDSDAVKLTGNQSIAGTKTFTGNITSSGSAFKRTSTIDPTTTTGETEVMAFQVVDKNGKTVASYNGTRSSTTMTNRQRVNNSNVSNGWFDLRSNVSDAGNAYISCAGSSTVTNLSHTYTTSSTGTTYIPTMGWVNNPSTSTNVVHRSGTETVSGNKTFSGTNSFTADNSFTNAIDGCFKVYGGYNTSTNTNQYKKIATCVISGTYQTRTIPFSYFRNASNAKEPRFDGKLVARVSGTAGTLDTGSSFITLGAYPDYVLNGAIDFIMAYKNNTPESNQVTVELWVYVKNTYDGVAIQPFLSASGYTTINNTQWTWGNPILETTEIPSDFSQINFTKANINTVTQVTSDNSKKIATTEFVKNNLSNYVTTGTTQTITADKTLSGTVSFTGTANAVTQTAGDNSTKVATTAYVDTAVSAATGTHIIETWHSGTEWYRVWSDGWCEQGGHMDKGSTISHGASWEVTVLLHKDFDDTNYSAFLTYTYGTSTNNTAGMEFHTNSKNTNYFKAHVYNRNSSTAINSTIGFDWEAKGYITIT